MRSGGSMISVMALGFSAAAAACNPAPPMAPVGVSDKAYVASDQSVDMDGGNGDNNACAHNPSLLEGKPCAPEGANCGSPSEDPHQFSNTLICHGQQWERVETPPLPLPGKS